ncbi:hypothetical protein E2320_011710 [Naja naja]|nr:hypothetical protein E2320_011710 [Naja naja]
MLVHFERWSHRYDEWIYWDSNRLRPLERPSLRKEGLKDDEFIFYDGVIRCLKRIHIKSMPEDAKGQARERQQIAPELRLVTDNEPREDWIALVKAAAVAAAKNKAGVKPRTSANSNKDKEERKWFKVPSKKEETSTSAIVQKVQKKEEQPTSSETFEIIFVPKPLIKLCTFSEDLGEDRGSAEPMTDTSDFGGPQCFTPGKFVVLAEVILIGADQDFMASTVLEAFPLVDVPKIAFVQAENALAHKRKNNLGNSFQAKRARLNKITGLLASKAVWADGAEKKEDCKEAAPVLEQEISPKPQSQKKNEADISSSANIQKSALLPSNLSSGKSRSKKCKQESGDSAGCLKPLKTPFSPELIQVEDLTLVSQLPSSGINKTSEHRHFKT